MATKINKVIELTATGGVLTAPWLTYHGISRSEQANYVKTGWLKRIDRGIYVIATEQCRFYPALYEYARQSVFPYHVGSFTALDLKGFTHYGQFGKPKVYLYSNSKIPSWLVTEDWNVEVIPMKVSRYGDVGLTTANADGIEISISSPERAFIECLDLVPEKANPMDLYYIMEMLTTLRPKLLQPLLELATIKTRRLFLYMADKAGHLWLEDIDLSAIDLGRGDRSICPGGKYDSKYRIVIPKELGNYE